MRYEIALELAAHLEQLEQDRAGSDSYDVTLDEFRRMQHFYPVTMARAVQTIVDRGPRHWDSGPDQKQPKPF